MKKTLFAALVIVGLMIVGVLTFVATNVQSAGSDFIPATVSIECAAAVDGTNALNFGYLSAPDGIICDEWRVEADNGGLLIHDVDGGGVDLNGSQSKGTFEVTGSEPVEITISVTDLDAGDFLSVSDVTLADGVTPIPYPFSLDLDQVNCSDPVEVSVGGTLTVCPGVTTGTHTVANITMTVNY